jgi:hypothetical protein
VKQLSRNAFKAKWRSLERLQFIAALKRYLGPYEIDPTEAEFNRQLGLSDEIFIKYESQIPLTARIEEAVRRVKPEDFVDLTTRIYGAPKTLKEVLADPAIFICRAHDAFTKEYRVAAEESLAGLKKKDIGPLLHHLSFLGTPLLRELQIAPLIDYWWLGAKQGNMECNQRWAAVRNALSPGGRSRNLFFEEAKEASRNAKARSVAVARMLRKYKKLLPRSNPEDARRQVEGDFKDSGRKSRAHDPHQEKLILQKFRKRIG